MLHFVMVYVLSRCTLCDIYVLKSLCFGTLTLCVATFCNITSCDVYVMLLYVMYQHRVQYGIAVERLRGGHGLIIAKG